MRPAALLAIAGLACAGTDYPDPVTYDCTRTVTCPGVAPVTSPFDGLCSASQDEAMRFTCNGTLEPGCTCTASCTATGGCR